MSVIDAVIHSGWRFHDGGFAGDGVRLPGMAADSDPSPREYMGSPISRPESRDNIQAISRRRGESRDATELGFPAMRLITPAFSLVWLHETAPVTHQDNILSGDRRLSPYPVVLAAELSHHLTTEAQHVAGKAGNHRNGSSRKTVITPSGALELNIPRHRLATAESDWGRKFSTMPATWRRQWAQVIPFFAYPPEVRKIIYTTNAIESLHMQLRKIVKNRGHFPSDEAASKLLFLALRNIEKDWKMPPIY